MNSEQWVTGAVLHWNWGSPPGQLRVIDKPNSLHFGYRFICTLSRPNFRALKISFKVLAKSKIWPKPCAYGYFVCGRVWNHETVSDFHPENCCLHLMWNLTKSFYCCLNFTRLWPLDWLNKGHMTKAILFAVYFQFLVWPMSYPITFKGEVCDLYCRCERFWQRLDTLDTHTLPVFVLLHI